MTATDAASATDGAAPDTTFESIDPRTGEVIGRHPVHDEVAVRAAVRDAGAAARWWAGLGFGGRRDRLAAWRALLVARLDELAELVCAETGKPLDDARLEVVLAVEHLDWAARNAQRVLRRRRVRPGLLMGNQAATVAYVPFGVVGVIGPWNYPVFTAMGSIAYALAAGNAVVLKPSELTPGVGLALAGTLAEVVPEHRVLTVATGFGPTGAALCRAGVGKLSFTGSTATGKRVMAACAESLTPVVIECGGSDPMIVGADADVAAAADAAVWGAMSNAGQTCVGVERVYVVDAVADAFVSAVTAQAGTLRPATDPGADFGPMTSGSGADVVREHIADAVSGGGRAVLGGSESVRPPFVEPVVLVDVDEQSRAVREETFGPLLVVNRVRDLDEAVERANGTPFGLGASVFAGAAGAEVATRLRCGMVAVDGVITFAGVPGLPFGGVGDSGFGRIHGPDGLREFTRTQSVTRQRFAPPIAVTTFRRSSRAMAALLRVVRLRHGPRRRGQAGR